MNTSIGTSRGKPASRTFCAMPMPPVDFHGAGVAPLHLRQELRRVLLLEQNAAHAAAAKIDRQRKPDRPGADDDDLRVQFRKSAAVMKRGKFLHRVAGLGWPGHSPAYPRASRMNGSSVSEEGA